MGATVIISRQRDRMWIPVSIAKTDLDDSRDVEVFALRGLAEFIESEEFHGGFVKATCITDDPIEMIDIVGTGRDADPRIDSYLRQERELNRQRAEEAAAEFREQV